LIDDVLDFTATEEILGKPVGNDLREGKVTLPLILALKQCTSAERQLVETVVRESAYQTVPLSAIQELLEKYGTIKTVRARALDYTEKAAAQLNDLPETPCKRALISLSEMVVDRES
jgi:octaprenyl-diphosphate synthase